MIILENNYKTVICPNCHSKLGVEKSDIKETTYGALLVKCPCCDELIEYGQIDITPDNIKFPLHFYYFGDDGTTPDIEEKDVRKFLRRAIDSIRIEKENFGFMSLGGRSYMSIKRYPGDEDYEVIIAPNYYHTYIDFTDDDKWEGWDNYDE